MESEARVADAPDGSMCVCVRKTEKERNGSGLLRIGEAQGAINPWKVPGTSSKFSTSVITTHNSPLGLWSAIIEGIRLDRVGPDGVLFTAVAAWETQMTSCEVRTRPLI